MTTDNPDPLEVFSEAVAAYQAKYASIANAIDLELADKIARAKPEADQAAAAIIAQHYAPVIAENERLAAENAALKQSLLATGEAAATHLKRALKAEE